MFAVQYQHQIDGNVIPHMVGELKQDIPRFGHRRVVENLGPNLRVRLGRPDQIVGPPRTLFLNLVNGTEHGNANALG